MTMKITKEWLKEKGACSDGKEWFLDQGIEDPIAGIKNLMKHDKLDWGNWLIVRVMTRPQYLAYAIFAAEQVIHIYEKRYPDNDKPRKAIEATKAVLANDNEKTRFAAADAACAAYAAAAAARKEMRIRILEYGISLLEKADKEEGGARK
jgi:immunity protein 5 of polymorphic toxin system